MRRKAPGAGMCATSYPSTHSACADVGAYVMRSLRAPQGRLRRWSDPTAEEGAGCGGQRGRGVVRGFLLSVRVRPSIAFDVRHAVRNSRGACRAEPSDDGSTLCIPPSLQCRPPPHANLTRPVTCQLLGAEVELTPGPTTRRSRTTRSRLGPQSTSSSRCAAACRRTHTRMPIRAHHHVNDQTSINPLKEGAG